MQLLEVSCAVRRIYRSLGVKGLSCFSCIWFVTAQQTDVTKHSPFNFHADKAPTCFRSFWMGYVPENMRWFLL